MSENKKITHVKLLRAYGKDPTTGKPYPIGSVLEVGKELPGSEVERVLKLQAGKVFEKQAGFISESEHNRKLEEMKLKAVEYKTQALQHKELITSMVERVDLEPLTVDNLKAVATVLELSGLGNADKKTLIDKIKATVKKD